jgi:hypothetical protein
MDRKNYSSMSEISGPTDFARVHKIGILVIEYLSDECATTELPHSTKQELFQRERSSGNIIVNHRLES